MSLDRFALDALRVAILVGAALASMPLLRRAPSAARRLVLAVALGGALVLPAVSALAPAWRVEGSPSIASLRSWAVAEPLAEDGPAVASAAPGEGGLTRAPSAEAPTRIDGTSVLVAIWALGALGIVARLGVGLARSWGVARRAAPAPRWAATIARAERSTGLRARVRVTDELDAPAVTGVLAPVVLVPRSSDEWSDERRYAVLLHELAHVRQHDCLAQIVAQLACAAQWFDPLVWMAVRRLRVERELAADDAVIAAGARASSYAEDLLAIAGETVAPREAPSGALGMAERSQLVARVTAILSTDRARRPLSRPRSALLVAAPSVLLFAVACATPSPQAVGAVAQGPDADTNPGSTSGASTNTAPNNAAPSNAASISAASSIDPKLQTIADEELDRAIAEWGAAAGVVVVLDPSTGEILANAGRSGGAPADIALRSVYVTGSTLKAITVAAALEEGVVTTADRFDCGNGSRSYGAKTLRDAGSYGSLTLPEMLAFSTNVGISKVFDRLGGDRLGRWLRRFHFGSAPGIEGAAAGDLPASIEDRSLQGAMVAMGGTMTASPLQVAAAYAALANDGVYLAPTLVRRTGDVPREQIVKPDTARTVVAMLEGAVNGERATGKAARVTGVRVAGKTGTAGWAIAGGGEGVYASFVGLVPIERPRFVILVGLEGPRRGASGGTVAAPAFARVAARALGY